MPAPLTAAQAPTATQGIRQDDANSPNAQNVIIHIWPEPAAGDADEAGSEPEILRGPQLAQVQERPAMPEPRGGCYPRQQMCGLISGMAGMVLGGLFGALVGGFAGGVATGVVLGVGGGLAGARSQGPLC
jgi:hypothetical protein